MKIKSALIIFIFFISLTACTTGQDSSETRQEVYFDDLGKSYDEGEIKITDTDLIKVTEKNTAGKNYSQEQTFIAGDKSKVTINNDRYGNKTETRCFVNHPRVDCVKVTTTTGGGRETFIYPVFGGAQALPENMIDQAMTASPDELADAAGIVQTRSDLAKKADSVYSRKRENETLQPMPSSQFPVFPRQTMPTVIEEKQVPENRQPEVEENVPPESANENAPDSKN